MIPPSCIDAIPHPAPVKDNLGVIANLHQLSSLPIGSMGLAGTGIFTC